ncbi:MAG: hypothetical protein R3B06_16475 [Kofleriaceae bacterium]
MPKVDAAKEPTGSFNQPGNHLTTRSIEPINLEIAMTESSGLVSRVHDIINRRQHSRIQGEILHADPDDKIRFVQQFSNALITEVTYPTFDASGKDTVFLKLKIQPETASFQPAPGSSSIVPTGGRLNQKLWTTSAFRLSLEINGKAFKTDFCTKVEGLSVKIGSKPVQRGFFVLPEFIPTMVTMPKLSFHMPLHYSAELVQWFNDAVHNEHPSMTDGEARNSGYEATGSLEFLDPTRTKTLYEIRLEGVGPEQMGFVKSEGGANTMKSCKFDCYLTNMHVAGYK